MKKGLGLSRVGHFRGGGTSASLMYVGVWGEVGWGVWVVSAGGV